LFLPGTSLGLRPSHLCLLCSWDYRCAWPYLACSLNRVSLTFCLVGPPISASQVAGNMGVNYCAQTLNVLVLNKKIMLSRLLQTSYQH
jgi:hypothetical protein